MPVKEKALVIYHGNCWDGFGAAWAAWHYYQDGAEYLPAKYGDRWPEGTAEQLVYLLDFSYPSDVLQKVMEDWSLRPSSLIIRDHHKTAADDILPWHAALPHREQMKVNPLFDMNHSGAVLAWNEFHPIQACPALLEYVEDRDLWRFALPHSREVAAWLRSWPQDFATWNHLETLVDQHLDQIIIEAEAILRFQQQQVDAMCDHAKFTIIGGHRVPIANATVFYSEVGEVLLNRYPDVPFAAYYMDREDGKRQFGLRSRPDFDCSVIAKALGGGGHPGAAGWVEHMPPALMPRPTWHCFFCGATGLWGNFCEQCGAAQKDQPGYQPHA